jgi:hypothetical protein
VYRKQDQPGGPATVCVGCFKAAGGVEKPYEPKPQTATERVQATFGANTQGDFTQDPEEEVPF